MNHTTNYQMSKKGAYLSIHVNLHEILHKEKHLPLKKSHTDG